MLNIEIDGKKLKAQEGLKIIEVCDNNNIFIPRLCYHKKLSIPANCRMCLVEVENFPKVVSACSTPIVEGMKIYTRSPKALAAKQSVMEFLLINHPLDCPVCDKGGECELQDLSLSSGLDCSRYKNVKKMKSWEIINNFSNNTNRSNKIIANISQEISQEELNGRLNVEVDNKNFSPLIRFNKPKCILCTRCIRFLKEITGHSDLGVINNSCNREISLFNNDELNSEFSGNLVDLCPVGALLSRSFKFSARSWELAAIPSIATHDCVGSNIYLHVKDNKIARIAPRENNKINETWICDRDRFSVDAVYSNDRLRNPIIKRNNVWEDISWMDALELIAKKLQKVVKDHEDNKVSGIGGLVSPNTSLEEQYLIQKLLKALGSNNIDYRLRQLDFKMDEIKNLSKQKSTNLGLSVKIDEIENLDGLLLIGSQINIEQPNIYLKLRKLIKNKGQIFVVNYADFDFNLELAAQIIVHPDKIVNTLIAIAKLLINNYKKNIYFYKDKEKKQEHIEDITTSISKVIESLYKSKEIKELFDTITPDKELELLVEKFLNTKEKLVLIGSLSSYDKNYSKILLLSNFISYISNAKFGVLTQGANSFGASYCGCVPYLSKSDLDKLNRDKLDQLMLAQEKSNLNEVKISLANNCHKESNSNKESKDVVNSNENINIETGLNAIKMFEKVLSTYLLFGIDPSLDCFNSNLIKSKLQKSDFVVAFTPFLTDSLKNFANIILPISTQFETSGTFINVCGDMQTISQSVLPYEQTKPLWKILRVMGNMLDIKGFEYEQTEDILEEITKKIGKIQKFETIYDFDILANENQLSDLFLSLIKNDVINDDIKDNIKNMDKDNINVIDKDITHKDNVKEINIFSRIPVVPIYTSDIVVRHSFALSQKELLQNQHFVKINSKMAKALEILNEDFVKVIDCVGNFVKMKLKIDESLQDGVAIIPQAVNETSLINVKGDKVIIAKS